MENNYGGKPGDLRFEIYPAPRHCCAVLAFVSALGLRTYTSVFAKATPR